MQGPINTNPAPDVCGAPSNSPLRNAGFVDHLQVDYQPPKDLRPADRNARMHTPKQIRQIAASIQQFGFINPILTDGHNGIVAGHGRWEAAKQLRLNSVPTLALAHLSGEELRAFALADNRLAELAAWDEELLAIELFDLSTLELDFDLEVIGFETPEIDLMIGKLDAEEESEPELPPPAPTPGPAVTQSGDIWCIGPHRLVCGDATAAETYSALLGAEMAQMVFSDPPYNVPIDGHVSGLGNVKHREFAMGAGEMTEEQFTLFLETVFRHLVNHSVDGSLH